MGHDRDPERRAPHLPGGHLRMPDERTRLRTYCRAAGAVRSGCRAAAQGRTRGRRCRGLQHVRSQGERRQPAVRQPGSHGEGQAAASRHADCGRRLHGAEGPQSDRREGALGGRRLRHQQHRGAAGSVGAFTGGAGGPGRDRRGAGDLPVQPADQARVQLRSLGFDQCGLQQHLYVLHRAQPAWQRDRPAARRDPSGNRHAGGRGGTRGDPARPERQYIWRRVR